MSSYFNQQHKKDASQWKKIKPIITNTILKSHRRGLRCPLQKQVAALFPHLLSMRQFTTRRGGQKNGTSKRQISHRCTRAEEAEQTEGSYGDKPFPLFGNYLAFSSPLRLITTRPGMTFGNGWGGPHTRYMLLLLLLSVVSERNPPTPACTSQRHRRGTCWVC